MSKCKKFKPKLWSKMTLFNDFCSTATPYVVVGYEKSKLLARECDLIFFGPRYFDTIADAIAPSTYGETIQLTWHPKTGQWQRSRYDYAVFGVWKHRPYTN